MSILGLYGMYSEGYEQPKDLEYAKCFWDLAKSIDDRLLPPIIKNLDDLCPPRPVVPYTRPGTE